MFTGSIVSPDDQKVTFVELFFDLVFVFSVTQVVGLLHHGLHWAAVGQGVLVFWLVWWAWTQFTWALNAADTTHPLVEMGTLLATAVAFFMAVAVPDAFHGHALWFAGPYVLVRLIGLGLYSGVARENASQRKAVQVFFVLSTTGLVAVLAGAFLGGVAQYICWGLAILLDVIAANIGGRREGWNLHPEHFVERHGLFVIIALGETLIVAASGVIGADWSSTLTTVAILAVALTCAMWWTYFTQAKPDLDYALEAQTGSKLSGMARDVFSLIHFPMLCGVIAYAVAIEMAIHHPYKALPFEAILSLAVGLLLFVGGMVLATWRATRRILTARLLLTLAVVVALVVIPNLTPTSALCIAFLGTVLIAVAEYRIGHHLEDQEI